jgi:hypothetical protein
MGVRYERALLTGSVQATGRSGSIVSAMPGRATWMYNAQDPEADRLLLILQTTEWNLKSWRLTEKRTVRKGVLAVGGILLMSTAAAALGQRKFDHVQYLKPGTKEQKKGDRPVNGSVVFDRNQKAVVFLDEKSNSNISIPTDKITDMVVEQKVPLLHTVSNKFLLTIRYRDTEGTGKSVVITLDKHNWRDVLIVAAAETGKEVLHKDGCCVL